MMCAISVKQRHEVAAECYFKLLRAIIDQCIADLAARDSLIKLDGVLYSSHEHARRFLEEGELFYLTCDILGIPSHRVRNAIFQRAVAKRALRKDLSRKEVKR